MEATVCCRFYYWSRSTKIIVQNAYTSAIEQLLLKWNGHDYDVWHDTVGLYCCHVTIFLVCSASGYPTPSILWAHNGTAVNGNDGLWIIIIQNHSNGSSLSMLSISTAAVNTSGEYTWKIVSITYTNPVLTSWMRYCRSCQAVSPTA